MFEVCGERCLWLWLPVWARRVTPTGWRSALYTPPGAQSTAPQPFQLERSGFLSSKLGVLLQEVTSLPTSQSRPLCRAWMWDPGPFSVFMAQALDRPDVEPRAVGPEEAARFLLTHACWCLVPSDVKRTKAGRELRLFPLPSVSRRPCPPNHVAPPAWTEVRGLLVMKPVVRSRARAWSPEPDHSVSCPHPLAPSLQASPEDHAA